MTKEPIHSSEPKMPPLSDMQELLWPFAALYSGALALRNIAFDKGWLASNSFNTPVIAVGNLSTGGTGKTPMTEFLLLSLSGKLAVVSRGYGRKTKGLLKVKPEGTAADYGDEPLQMARKFPKTSFVVAEKRVQGIQHLLESEKPDCIILDDAYQHRYVKAGFYILLSTWQEPFFNDQVLPAGSLRESKHGAGRANAIIFTKCPLNLDHSSKEKVIREVRKYSNAPVYFAGLAYEEPKNSRGEEFQENEAALLTGIAKPLPLHAHLQKRFKISQHFSYGDHHTFRESEIREVDNYLRSRNLALLTTEKDFARLRKWFHILDKQQVYAVPVATQFEAQEKAAFLKQVNDFINGTDA